MNAQTETNNAGLEAAKWFLALAIAAGGVAAFYHFAEWNHLLRVLMVLVAVGVAAGVAYTTAAGRFAWGFMGESRAELRKVVWPTRKETTNATMLVLVIVLIAGIVLWLIDVAFHSTLGFLLSHGGS